MSDDLTNFLIKIDYFENHDPRKLIENKVPLDRKIKNSVLKINRSNWVWTLWSCQGHNRGVNKGSVPYLVFIVEKKNLGNLLTLIHNSTPKIATTEFPCYNGSFCYEISPGFEDEKYCIISLHYSLAYGTLKLNLIQQSMNTLAESISEATYG